MFSNFNNEGWCVGRYLQMEGMNSVTVNVFYNICTGRSFVIKVLKNLQVFVAYDRNIASDQQRKQNDLT